MMHSKGAVAPFFLPLCSPRLRDDALLTHAIEAFESGHYADALLAVEYVCRRFPSKSIPAILRAKILQACSPELTAKAWYRAWFCDPETPMLQDAMLRAWLNSGAAVSVLDLGPAFLPERCRAGKHTALIQLLHEAGANYFGACWKSGEAIEGMLFGPTSVNAPGSAHSQKMRLIISDQTSQFQYDIPADGNRFRLACPKPNGVWSVAFAVDNDLRLMHGSPLVFEQDAPIKLSSAEALKHTVPRTKKNVTQQRNPVDIIIPVYRDRALVKACIDSVLTSLPLNTTHARLIVIDDASPEPALSAWLDTLAESGRITLLRNRYNLGFIEATNRGLRHHPTHDVILLNADTLVHGDWIDRLATALFSEPDIASVTPWSNNGEISSFPKIATPSPSPSLTQLGKVDQIAATLRSTGATADVELPSCCGFTMMIRRSVLDRIGMLDGAGLTRGYGEEVDWCLRARAAGYRHLLATGVFIAHTGTVSFRFEKTLRVRQNRAVLLARYPHYHPEYHRFLDDDPLKTARQTLRSALEQTESNWLDKAVNVIEGKSEFGRALPAALPSSCPRIAVWQHQFSTASAGKILALARIIASQPALTLRLLIIGEVNEALWHTGVVDVLPSAAWHESILFTDAAMVGLSGCTALLTEHPKTAPIDIAVTLLDEKFEPQAWLADWLAQQVQSICDAPKRKANRARSKQTATA